MNRILIVEDEPRIVSFLEKGLQANGFVTSIARNGKEAVPLAVSNDLNLIILDLGLPEKDGMTVLEELRGQGLQIPIIILTARFEVNDRVVGLEGGADDYLIKPFHFEELLARIRVRLRHQEPSGSCGQTVLTFKDIALDLRTRQVRAAYRPVELSSREFALTEMFLRHPGQVLSRQQLLDQVWGYDYDPGSNIVDVYVGYLRKKLGSDLIETVRGMGYRLRS
jgi:DNA-binding response OmpR family regulator